jgi:uncharacterized RDD family membrane protein YckC
MEFAYASAWKRIVTGIIDIIVSTIIGIPAVLLMTYIWSMMLGVPLEESRYQGMSALFAWLYDAILVSSSKQGTIGYMALGLKVSDENGRRISFLRATGRHFAIYLSVIPLGAGLFMAFFTQKRQTLHDMMAGCIVIDERADSIPSQHIDSRRQQVATPLSPVTRTSPAPAAPSPALTTLNGPPTSPSPQSHSLPSSENITITTMSDHSPALDEDAIYAIIADEIESGKTDKGLWTRLFAELDGDEKKTKLAYIKQRAAKLIAAEQLRIQEEHSRQILAEEAAETERLRRMSIVERFNERKSQGLLPALESYNFLSLVRRGAIDQVKQALAEEDLLLFLTDSEGNTALHVAMYDRNQYMIEILIKAGALANIQNAYGKSPSDLAQDKPELRKLLTELGVEV